MPGQQKILSTTCFVSIAIMFTACAAPASPIEVKTPTAVLPTSTLTTPSLTPTVPLPSPTPSAWIKFSAMPEPRFETTAVTLDGYIYVLGGLSIRNSHNTAFRYDPNSDTWEELAPMPDFRNHIGAAVLNGKIYASGGIYGETGFDGSAKTLWAYDPEIDEWTSLAEMPIGRQAHGMAAIDGKLYVVGGTTSRGGDPSELWVYDTETASWDASRAPLPTMRDHLTVASYDGKLYAIGGRYSTNLPTVEIYDPLTDTWSRGPDMPTPRSGMGATLLNGQLHAIAGEDVVTEMVYKKHEVLDFGTMTWTSLPDIPWPLNAPIVAEVDGYIYVMGGASKLTYPYKDIWKYTP